MSTETSIQFITQKSDYKDLKNELKGKSKVLLLTDDNTTRLCKDIFEEKIEGQLSLHHSLVIGENHKSLEQVHKIYEILLDNDFDRKSAIVNLGGGMVSDLGGFVAATYKRGIDYFNVPTTLLSMLDASFGGKTGVNFNDLKNQIGCFHHPKRTVIDVQYLETLSEVEKLSGFAELIKHALIADKNLWQDIQPAKSGIQQVSWDKWIPSSVKIKKGITDLDPFEKKERKLLNFGHSIGHALESFYNHYGPEISHGYAVAIGMICESKLSEMKGFIKKDALQEISMFISAIYPKRGLNLSDIDSVIKYLQHDKKNELGTLNFTLLSDIGQGKIDQVITEDEVREAIHYYLDLS